MYMWYFKLFLYILFKPLLTDPNLFLYILLQKYVPIVA